MSKYLDGHARVVVRDSATQEVFFDDEVSFGDGATEISFVNDRGVEVGIDKSGRMVPTFATRTNADVASLVDAVQVVLDALAGAGVKPFLAYGTLLGAVREGAVLGHDSDADVGYVSDFTNPGRRDPRVVPAPAGDHQARVAHVPLQRLRVQDRRSRKTTG